MQNENKIFDALGIELEDGKLEIDFNKTKSFLQGLEGVVKQKAQEIKKQLDEGKIDLKQSAGVQVDKDHIEIDIQKGKSFIENLGSKIGSFFEEVQNELKEMTEDKNLPK